MIVKNEKKEIEKSIRCQAKVRGNEKRAQRCALFLL